MTLARTLASFGVRCLLVERNAVDHAASQDGHHQRPLDGAVPAARPGRQAARRRGARGEQFRHLLDHVIAWSGGRELHRFRYPSVVEKRAEIRASNDGTQPREPAMRVSQVMIEPVLRDAIVGHPLVDARWGVAFEDFDAGRGRA